MSDRRDGLLPAKDAEHWCPVHGKHEYWDVQSDGDVLCGWRAREDCHEAPIDPDIVAAIRADGCATARGGAEEREAQVVEAIATALLHRAEYWEGIEAQDRAEERLETAGMAAARSSALRAEVESLRSGDWRRHLPERGRDGEGCALRHRRGRAVGPKEPDGRHSKGR